MDNPYSQNHGGHSFLPITDLYARCSVCQKRFGIVYFFNTAQFPVCAGVPPARPTPKIYRGSKAKIRIKKDDGTWEELGIVNGVTYVNTVGMEPVYVLGKKKACECGAAKTGVKDYKPGHSSWCPVKETP